MKKIALMDLSKIQTGRKIHARCTELEKQILYDKYKVFKI